MDLAGAVDADHEAHLDVARAGWSGHQDHVGRRSGRPQIAMAAQRPLLLLIDDLQWADAESISLLFHLSRRIEGSCILVVGSYRPAPPDQRSSPAL